MDYVLNVRRRDISEEIVHPKKTRRRHQLLPSHRERRRAKTHIKALVALIDEDEKEALFKAAEEEGF